MDASRRSGKNCPSSGPASRRVKVEHGFNPLCSLCCPQPDGAMYPPYIREQRTNLDVLRNRKPIETPGPGAYDVDPGYRACLPSSRSITIQGVRRPKRHDIGPFTTF
ncbi:protein STPG3 [Coturnix japonica]|uniref:protein STPG3 n=1 Tax=Coturnix japonica TaxID=93934 RepID=UPI000777862A|nr:protein STPG3 [Coturnix japonica]